MGEYEREKKRKEKKEKSKRSSFATSPKAANSRCFLYVVADQTTRAEKGDRTEGANEFI
jgi:hypothetical protein